MRSVPDLDLLAGGESWSTDPARFRARYGGKALGLVRLHRAGLRVPPTWVFPVGREPVADDVAALSTVAPRWAVRSSATVEDGTRHSYAGLFVSRIDVAVTDLLPAMGEVIASAGHSRVASYRSAMDAKMAVVLQPFVEPVAAGVWIGRDLGSGRLEWVFGNGGDLVSGRCVPFAEEWPSSDGPGMLRADGVPVGGACLAVQRTLGEPLDLEFAVLPSGLTWLQCRAVTGDPLPPRQAEPAGDLVGVPASPGVFRGPAVVLRDHADPRWLPGSVLVTGHTDADWIPVLAEAGAVVTASGGALSHAAIIARELGVPCVAGVANACTELRAGMNLQVDGTAGCVTVL